MLEKIKIHSLWWMKSYNINICLNYHTWWSTLLILSIGAKSSWPHDMTLLASQQSAKMVHRLVACHHHQIKY
jgi:hypothetical protein